LDDPVNPVIKDEHAANAINRLINQHPGKLYVAPERGMQKLTGENLNVTWPEFSTLCQAVFLRHAMEQHTLKNVNNNLNNNIYSYLEASGGQSSNTYLNVVHFFNTSVN